MNIVYSFKKTLVKDEQSSLVITHNCVSIRVFCSLIHTILLSTHITKAMFIGE